MKDLFQLKAFPLHGTLNKYHEDMDLHVNGYLKLHAGHWFRALLKDFSDCDGTVPVTG